MKILYQIKKADLGGLTKILKFFQRDDSKRTIKFGHLLLNSKKGVVFVRFQWLKDYQELDEQILYLKWNLNKSKLELNRWVNGDLADVRIEKNSRSASLEENIKKIENELRLLNDQKEEMLLLIDSFSGIDNQIIKMKYIDGMKLEDIAEEIDYAPSYVRQRHAEIRKTLNFIDEYEQRRADRCKKESEIEFYNSEKYKEQLSLF